MKKLFSVLIFLFLVWNCFDLSSCHAFRIGDKAHLTSLADTDQFVVDDDSNGSATKYTTPLDIKTYLETFFPLETEVPLDSDFGSNGIMKRTGAGAYGIFAVENALSADDNVTFPTSYAIKKYGDDNWGGTGAGNVTASNDITDNRLIKGDGGAKGVQETGIVVSDTNAMSGVTTVNTGPGDNELYAMNQDVEDDDNVTFNKVTVVEGFVSAAKPLPGWEFDVNSTVQEVKDAWIYAQATNSGNGTEYIDLLIKELINGILTTTVHIDASAGEIVTTLQFVTTGDIMGGVNVSSKSAAYTVGTDDPSEAYGTMFINSDNDTQPWTLLCAAGGMSACFINGQGVACSMNVTAGAGDYIVLDGTRTGAAGTVSSTGALGDFLCIFSVDATDWYVMGKQGTWGVP